MLKGFEFDLLYKEVKASVKRECGNVRYLNKDTFKMQKIKELYTYAKY